ncbi:MAG: prepilin-type N-terminal cleavage/methylation domain-containing protein [Actinomycetota bacterium]|nr:prepilin-type N-terminal cleavage/methylation domain-containing protein [Actinomycetota bacterium]
MKFFRKDEGFTLVELMVVVLIIGILIAIAVPVFNSARANAQKRSCQANQRTFEGAYQTWYADDPGNSVIAAGLIDLAGLNGVLVPQFIKAEPDCPGEGTYSAVFTTNGLSVDLQCTVAGHVN